MSHRMKSQPPLVLDEWQRADWVAELKAMVGQHEAKLRHSRVRGPHFPTAERKKTFTAIVDHLAEFLLNPNRVH